MNRAAVTLVSVASLSLCAFCTFAQTNSALPQPLPEAKKLGVYVGKWTVEADLPGSGEAPATKTHGTVDCEWVAEQSGILCRENIPIPGRPGLIDVYLMAYDEHAKNYFFTQISAGGYLWKGSGSVDGDTWTWIVNDTDSNGKPFQARFTEKFSSPDIIQFKNGFSEAGEPFQVMMQGTQSRK